MVGPRRNAGPSLLPQDAVEQLERRWLNDVLRADADSLSRERKLLHVLYWAREIDPERTDGLAQRISSRDDGFLQLLRSSLTEAQTLGGNDVVARVDPRLPWESLEKVVGADVLERRVRELSGRPYRQDLDERTSVALETAKRYVGGWRPDF